MVAGQALRKGGVSGLVSIIEVIPASSTPCPTLPFPDGSQLAGNKVTRDVGQMVTGYGRPWEIIQRSTLSRIGLQFICGSLKQARSKLDGGVRSVRWVLVLLSLEEKDDVG